MRTRLSHPAVYLPAFMLAAAGLLISTAAGNWTLTLNGNRAGVVARGDALSLVLGVRWGWPSKAWIDREPLRSPGETFKFTARSRHDLESILGFGVYAGGTRWNGHDVITVHHVTVAVPWWFLLLVAAAPPLERTARWLGSHRPAERRRREGRCAACGYDLRATPSRCPECGVPPASDSKPMPSEP